MNDTLSIGKIAERANVKVVTVRYYESIGLLPEPARTHGNYRAYNAQHLERLEFIRRSRDLGFTLDQIRDMLKLSGDRGRECRHVDDIARVHLADVEAKLADLTRLAKELRRIVKRCEGGSVGVCRIVEALSEKPEMPVAVPKKTRAPRKKRVM